VLELKIPVQVDTSELELAKCRTCIGVQLDQLDCLSVMQYEKRAMAYIRGKGACGASGIVDCMNTRSQWESA
jgi:hypothetical protein